MSTEAQLKSEIERLTGIINLVYGNSSQFCSVTATINKHKSGKPTQLPSTGFSYRSNTYVNPNYKPSNTYIRPTPGPSNLVKPVSQPAPSTNKPKEVVLGGVAFSSSRRSLVRKDLPKPAPSTTTATSTTTNSQFTRKSGHLIAATRAYKSHSTRGRRGGAANRNMTLTNSRRPFQSVWLTNSGTLTHLTILDRARRKRMKSLNKQCPRFSTTGAPSCHSRHDNKPEKVNSERYSPLFPRFLSPSMPLLLQHDPLKIAICWNFLQDNCPNDADTCNLSHDPTPERTPLCLHFLNKGRCTRQKCLFPHVNVGARHGVCRDFAVLGYCEKGLDCDKQHVRECPDFAEKGTCSTKGCKLPHVIRANRNRKPLSDSATSTSATTADSSGSPTGTEGERTIPLLTANDAQMGDEYISLTFNESESEDEDEEEDEEEDGDEDDEDGSDGDDPDDVSDLPIVG
ncbi:hypothetical protein AAF712_007867 [Marasmius tenuissimus]|uniref:C3H1-type domain-containing protein n=1 Tax=Marasmius tenuissimus TaxID=585030 RepID=A0ABR2ZVV4_9AGAR